MTRPIKAEVDAVTAVLEQPDWETPEQAAEAAIKALDAVRDQRITFGYIAVIEYPLNHKDAGKAWYTAVGPYPGAKTARNALNKQLALVGNLARVGVVVPIRTPHGYEQLLKEVG